jgi:hypothetical protein
MTEIIKGVTSGLAPLTESQLGAGGMVQAVEYLPSSTVPPKNIYIKSQFIYIV